MPIQNSEYDVAVAGGGPSGFAAALASARSGARTILVERYGCLGGMASTGLPFLTYRDSSGQLVFGIADEFARRARDLGFTADEPSESHWLVVDPEGVKYIFQEMLLEAGADLLLHSWICDARVSSSGLEALHVLSKGGIRTIRAKAFVDCTGDADVAALCNVPFDVGREDGKTMGMSLLFSLANVDTVAFVEGVKSRWADLVKEKGIRIPDGIKDATFLDETRFMPFMVNPMRPGEVIFNWVQLVLDLNPLDPDDLTRAEVDARRRIHLFFKEVMKPHVPGCADSYIAQTASQLGIRESRRIRGLYTLTEDDCRSDREFEDTIAICTYPFDLHASSRSDEKNVVMERGFQHAIRIPYRIMVPASGPDNLLVAGRSVSADRMALSAIRVMVPCMSMGEAAGYAAGMAAKESLPVKDVDVARVRERLDLRL
jgi:hypothetical protein